MLKEIVPLFPTAVLAFEMERDFTNEEIDTMYSILELNNPNIGNTISQDYYVLNRPELSDLRKMFVENFSKYIEEIIKPTRDVDVYLTQSWLNLTKIDQFHHMHNHPNSYLSAVLYIESTNADQIVFFKEKYQQIKLEPKEFNAYNSDSWWYPARKGTMLVFPSSVQHSVDQKHFDGKRVSLACNMVPKGALGNAESMNELIW